MDAQALRRDDHEGPLMPGSTPIYQFPFPCYGETVSPLAFQQLANAIDAKMNDVRADYVLALNRNNVDLLLAGTQTITAGVDTVLTLTDSTYTIPVAGVWIIDVDVIPASSPATITMMRARVRQNGVVRFGFNQTCAGNTTARCYPSGPVVAAAGDVITTQFLYTGAGTMNVSADISAKMLVRIA